MPFYEYECTNCKFYSEVMQKISDPSLRKCSSCGKSTMKKLVSAPNFRLKGGGWYETDFKSDQEKKRNLAVDKEPDAPAAPETKSDAKPAETKAGEPKAAETKPVAGKSGGRKSVAVSRKPAAAKAKAKTKSSGKRPKRR
jgi:putative FmdB family regulatory protein